MSWNKGAPIIGALGAVIVYVTTLEVCEYLPSLSYERKYQIYVPAVLPNRLIDALEAEPFHSAPDRPQF